MRGKLESLVAQIMSKEFESYRTNTVNTRWSRSLSRISICSTITVSATIAPPCQPENGILVVQFSLEDVHREKFIRETVFKMRRRISLFMATVLAEKKMLRRRLGHVGNLFGAP